MVRVFAHTGGHALETWWVEVDVRTDALTYVSHTGASAFNGVVFEARQLGDTGYTRLSFSAVGTKVDATSSQIIGTAVPLLDLTLRAATGLPPGVPLDAAFRVYARQLINAGSFTFVENAPGVILDTLSAGGALTGTLQIAQVRDMGLLAYAPGGPRALTVLHSS